jgi:predicted DNA-binding transcriptional regulator AlpA
MDRAYTEEELAGHLGLSPKTLAYWRARGKGPKYFRAGKHVRYRESAIVEWEKAQEREATSARS